MELFSVIIGVLIVVISFITGWKLGGSEKKNLKKIEELNTIHKNYEKMVEQHKEVDNIVDTGKQLLGLPKPKAFIGGKLSATKRTTGSAKTQKSFV